MNLKRLQVAFDRVRESVTHGEMACAVLAVANHAEIIRCEAFSGKDEVTTDSIFLLASITKPITATAIMQLFEQGKLVLDKPIQYYWPQFARPGKADVTIWNLLTHTSGLEGEAWMNSLMVGQAPLSAYYEAVCSSTLNFFPGSHYQYCTLSFYALAELVSLISGMEYSAYLKQNIFDPLGMAHISFDPAPDERAYLYGDLEPIVDYFITTRNPGGGLWASVDDLIRFGQAYLNAERHDVANDDGYRILAPSTIDLMTRDHLGAMGITEVVNNRAQPAHYALGWGKATCHPYRPGSPRVYEHGGSSGTLLWIDPDADLIYILLTNHWGMERHIQEAALQAVYAALR